jgi:hypothetical protein
MLLMRFCDEFATTLCCCCRARVRLAYLRDWMGQGVLQVMAGKSRFAYAKTEIYDTRQVASRMVRRVLRYVQVERSTCRGATVAVCLGGAKLTAEGAFAEITADRSLQALRGAANCRMYR